MDFFYWEREMPRTQDVNTSTITGISSLDTNSGSVSIGGTASGTNAIALVTGSSATGTNSIAIGENRNSSADGAVVLGVNGTCSTPDGLCINTSCTATTGSAFLISANSSGADVTNQLGVGSGSTVTGTNATLIGKSSSVAQAGTGVGAGVSCGVDGVAMGFETESATGGVSMFDRAKATATNSIAFGAFCEAYGTNSICFGRDNAAVTGDNSTVLGVGLVGRVSNETVCFGSRSIREATVTSSTATTDIITFPISTDELFHVRCWITERNTASSARFGHYLKDYFVYDNSGVTNVSAGTLITAEPGGATTSTVDIVVSGNDLVVQITPGDTDARSWVAVLVLQNN